jgi:hypothetical protein
MLKMSFGQPNIPCLADTELDEHTGEQMLRSFRVRERRSRLCVLFWDRPRWCAEEDEHGCTGVATHRPTVSFAELDVADGLFVDATSLNRRIARHQVVAGLAQRGKTTMG